MPIELRKCKVCGKEFHGQKNALYCSTSCKQKAYRSNKQKIKQGE